MQFIYRDLEGVNCYSFTLFQSDQRWIRHENTQTVNRRTKRPDQIAALKKAGALNKEIAEIVETSESTISRELKRATGSGGYRPKQAQNKALRRKQNAVKSVKMTVEVIALVEAQIRLNWSPEQVSGRLKD